MRFKAIYYITKARRIKEGRFTMSRSGIVNVRMVITEEKILSNIDKVQKLINPSRICNKSI